MTATRASGGATRPVSPAGTGVPSPLTGCTGWRRAYVDWRVEHAGELDAIGLQVREPHLELLVHELFESAVRHGWGEACREEAWSAFCYRWRSRTQLPERVGHPCRVTARRDLDIRVEFEDGFEAVASRWSVRRIRREAGR